MSNIDQLITIQKYLRYYIGIKFFLTSVLCTIWMIGMDSDLKCQTYYSLSIGEMDSLTLTKNDLYPRDSLSLDSIRYWLNEVQDEGFLEASIDDIVVLDSVRLGRLYLGSRYHWLQLNNHNIEEDILEQSRIDLSILNNKAVNLSQLKQIKDNILSVCDNNGYPYAKIWNDNIVVTDSTIRSDLILEKGLLVTYEPLVLEGDVKISSSYLSSYLGIKEGRVYNKSELEKIGDKLNNLSFLSLKSNARALFRRDKARIELPLARRRSSRFDFLLGFQPNTGIDASGVTLTGTFLGDFINQLGQGERIYIAYKRLGVQTQELDVALNYPYILGSPLGFDGSFDLYKRDSSFVNIDAELGVQVLLSGTNYIKAFWNNQSTNLAQVDTLMVMNSSQENLDTRFSNFGLELSWRKLNHPQSPSRGYLIKTRASVGQRTIKKNQDILESNPTFYDDISESSFQSLITTDLQYYIPMGKRATILLRGRGGWLNGADTLYRNQLFRIGGNQILRGFDDESIFASLYGVGTVEYRYLLGSNRYIFLFGDAAIIQEESKGNSRDDIPLGLGAGIRFQTSAGVFSLTYGVGKQEGAGFDFSRSKIHFGYVTFF